jgi:hypothetical protein
MALSLPALVIGSLVPDTAYALRNRDLEAFAHQFAGSLGYCLPTGLAAVGLFALVRRWAVQRLAAPYRVALLPSSQRSLGSPWRVLLSLVLGIWTHLLWDSFTHRDGWLVQHWPVFEIPLFSLGGRTARVCHLLSYGSSFIGVAWVLVVFERWKQACAGRSAATSGRALLRDAALAAGLVLPVYLLHHLTRGPIGLFLTAVLSVLAIATVLARTGRRHSGARPDENGAAGQGEA